MPNLTPATPPRLLTLVLAAAASALAMNVFLPSMPGMARYFNVEYALMQLTVSVYLAANAGIQLFIGPMSDRYGRRPVLIVCFAIFIAATIAAILSPNFEFLLAMRVLQAFSAAGLVVPRALVRDMGEPARAASLFGYITMGMALAPMAAPVVGGLLDEMFDWRATFGLLLAFGVIAFAFILLDLGETNHNRSESFGAQFRSYPELLLSRRFWGYVMAAGFTSGQFFAFLGGGPFVATEIMHLTPSAYGLLFGIISAGYVLGNFISGRFTERVGIRRMILTGNLLAMSGLLVSLALLSSGLEHPLSFFGPVVMIGLGNGMALPSVTAGMVSVRPHLAGSAAGLGSAMQIGVGAAFSVLGGLFLTVESGAFPLIYVMLGASAGSITCAIYVILVERSLARTVE